jgi:hypothetical protein
MKNFDYFSLAFAGFRDKIIAIALGLFILILFPTFWACKKEAAVKTSTNQPLALSISTLPDEDILKKMVKTGAIGLLELSKNANFRALVRTKPLKNSMAISTFC